MQSQYSIHTLIMNAAPVSVAVIQSVLLYTTFLHNVCISYAARIWKDSLIIGWKRRKAKPQYIMLMLPFLPTLVCIGYRPSRNAHLLWQAFHRVFLVPQEEVPLVVLIKWQQFGHQVGSTSPGAKTNNAWHSCAVHAIQRLPWIWQPWMLTI